MNSSPQNPVIVYLDAIDSTNNYAANLLKQTKVVNGTIILTKRQENGKGQRGTTWQSEPEKNLICSTIIFPHIGVKEVFTLNMITSLAVVDLLSDECISNIGLKWPNDVYVGHKKIAGILIETQLAGPAIKSAIIGLGLNVNQEKFYGSFEPTSMILERGFATNIDRLVKSYWEKLRFYIELYDTAGRESILERYYKQLIGYKRIQQFEDESGPFEGEIIGVDQFGRLCIRKNDGHNYTYQIKEVKQIRPAV